MMISRIQISFYPPPYGLFLVLRGGGGISERTMLLELEKVELVVIVILLNYDLRDSHLILFPSYPIP